MTKTVLTLMPLSFVKASSSGWISLGSRVVYRLTSSAALADTVKAAAPASASARSSEFNWGRLIMKELQLGPKRRLPRGAAIYSDAPPRKAVC
ncbi:hypothetical protein D3C72_1650240 [compost metagenome]